MEVTTIQLPLDGSTDLIEEWLSDNETATINFMQTVPAPTGPYLLIFYTPA